MIKNNISKLIALFVTAGIVLTSCDKDDDGTPDQVRRMMFNWKITDITTPKVNQPATDSSLYKACMADDVIKFSNTGFEFLDGANTCDTTIFPYAKGSWTYRLSGDSVQMASTQPAPGRYSSWKVLTLNDTLLKVRYTDSTNPAKKIQKTISFKH